VIYLLDEAGKHVGPFENREGVRRFIQMMALCGENWGDNKIIEECGCDAPGLQNPPDKDSCASRLKSIGRLKLAGRRS